MKPAHSFFIGLLWIAAGAPVGAAPVDSTVTLNEARQLYLNLSLDEASSAEIQAKNEAQLFSLLKKLKSDKNLDVVYEAYVLDARANLLAGLKLDPVKPTNGKIRHYDAVNRDGIALQKLFPGLSEGFYFSGVAALLESQFAPATLRGWVGSWFLAPNADPEKPLLAALRRLTHDGRPGKDLDDCGPALYLGFYYLGESFKAEVYSARAQELQTQAWSSIAEAYRCSPHSIRNSYHQARALFLADHEVEAGSILVHLLTQEPLDSAPADQVPENFYYFDLAQSLYKSGLAPLNKN